MTCNKIDFIWIDRSIPETQHNRLLYRGTREKFYASRPPIR